MTTSHRQHTATHCNTLQHTATHCNTLQHTATHCNTLQHTATHCNTLQHTAAHCNTLQHTTSLFCIDISILEMSHWVVRCQNWHVSLIWFVLTCQHSKLRRPLCFCIDIWISTCLKWYTIGLFCKGAL